MPRELRRSRVPWQAVGGADWKVFIGSSGADWSGFGFQFGF